MKFTTGIIFTSMLSTACIAQQTPAATAPQDTSTAPKYGWKNTMVAMFNLAQVSLSNWAKGGENTLSWTGIVNGQFVDLQEFYKWTNNLKVTYGQAKIGSREFEKTDDELYFESVYSRELGWPVSPYGAFSARTQLAPGYKIIDSLKTQTSGPFDPAYLTESAGFTYSSGPEFVTRLGVAVRETFTSTYSTFGYADNPKTTEIEKTRVQTGIESVSGLKLDLMQNILFTSQLSLFSAFETIDVWDVRWDNMLTAKVNSYISTTLSVQVIHEIAQTRRTQVKETLALGLSYTLF